MSGGEIMQPGDPDRQVINVGWTQEQKFPVRGVGESERNMFSNPRLHLFADLGSDEIRDDIGRRIVEHLKKLSEVNASRRDVQISIEAITQELLLATFEKKPHEDILLVPVLRAGLAMWDEANEFFGFPETSFVWGKKEKGTDRASVLWPKRNSIDDKQIIVLDPIIATGDTLLQVCTTITEFSTKIPSLKVLSCYAAPQGVQAVLDKTNNVDLIVGCMAKTVGADGYLIPPTNGDMGDKLFGSVPDR